MDSFSSLKIGDPVGVLIERASMPFPSPCSRKSDDVVAAIGEYSWVALGAGGLVRADRLGSVFGCAVFLAATSRVAFLTAIDVSVAT